VRHGRRRLWGSGEGYKPINRMATHGVAGGHDEGRTERPLSEQQLIITQLLDKINVIRKSSYWAELEKEKSKARLKWRLRKEFRKETKFKQGEKSKKNHPWRPSSAFRNPFVTVLFKAQANESVEQKSEQLKDIRTEKLISTYDEIYGIVSPVAMNNSNLFKHLIDVFTWNIRDIWQHGKTTPDIDTLFIRIQQLIRTTSPAIYESELAAIEGIRQRQAVETVKKP
jgi:hypothetical protein